MKLTFEKMWEEAKYLVFDAENTARSYTEALPAMVGYQEKHWFYFYENGMGAAYYEKNDIAEARVFGARYFLKRENVDTYFNGIAHVLTKTKNIISRIENSPPHQHDNEFLKSILSEADKLQVELFGYFHLCQPQFVEALETRVLDDLRLIVPQEILAEVFALLASSSEINDVRQEQIDWNVLLSNTSSGNPDALRQSLESHWKKYRLLGASDGNAPFTSEHYQERFVHDMESSRMDDNRADVQGFGVRVPREQRLMIEKYSIPSNLVDICNLLAKIGHQRLQMRVLGWVPLKYYMHTVLEEIGKRHNFDKEYMQYMRCHEVEDLLAGNVPNKNTIAARQKAFMFEIINGELILHAGETARGRFKELLGDSQGANVTELSGRPVMRGKVTGTALVFQWTDDMKERMKELRNDTVLIVGQTRPQLMPMLSRVKAIVTDEGGIISHAAIVSRELGVPCIIGTKIATQVLKDGDMVEVDANMGVVRILGN